MPTPMLRRLKDIQNKPTILKHLVDDWLIDNLNVPMKYGEEGIAVVAGLLREGTVRKKTVFSPSNAIACSRAQVLDKLKYRPVVPSDPQLLSIFEDGIWRHMKWQLIFNAMGLVESIEQFNSLGYLNYGGSTDLILNIPHEGSTKRVIVDIKGANSFKWSEINMSGEPVFAHKIQVQIYMLINKIDMAILWYENKNTNEICEVVVHEDKELQRQAVRRQRYMKKFVLLEGMPKEECDIDNADKVFQQCPQRINCQRLPVHGVVKGQLQKIGNPRKGKDSTRHRQLPLKKYKGRLADRVRHTEKSQDWVF